MGDILKEAIADAKAVRETALQNAKMALEEAFTPQLKSMLSAKLREEDDDEKEEGRHEEDMDDDDAEEGRMDDGMHDEGEHEEGMHDDEAEEGRHDKEEGMHDDDDDAEEGMHEDNIIEIDGVKYAPIVAEKEDDDDDAEEGRMSEEELDLESVIKELESELDEDIEEGKEKDDDDDDTKLKEEEEFEIDESLFEEDEELDEELDKSSDIGKSDNNRGSTDASSGIGSGKKGMKESSKLQAELKEYKEAVVFLKDKLHEVNILNAKLLFTNKLFKEYSLDNGQKLKVVETFDRAQTTREIKLVYSTLAESFKSGPITRKTKNITESASSAVGSTKPSKQSRKVITEEQKVANRFRKLAGLIK